MNRVTTPWKVARARGLLSRPIHITKRVGAPFYLTTNKNVRLWLWFPFHPIALPGKGHFQAVAWLKAPQHWPGSEASSPLISRDRGFTCVRVEPISSPQSTTRFNQNDLELEVCEP